MGASSGSPVHPTIITRPREGSNGDSCNLSEVLSSSHRGSLKSSGSHASLIIDDSASLGSSSNGYCNGSGKCASGSHSGGNSSDMSDEEPEDEDEGDDDGIEKKIRWFFKNIERDEALYTSSISSKVSSHEEE